jgi:uncharacterized ion transporter superfamily protein YfcC
MSMAALACLRMAQAFVILSAASIRDTVHAWFCPCGAYDEAMA